MIKLDVNDREHTVEAEKGELLVWVIHEKLGLTLTRFGCGIEFCGACKVVIDGEICRSCQIGVTDAVGKKIYTREGLPQDHPLNE